MRVGEIVAAKATHRDRIVGTHWWNPPYLVPLVEVVQGDGHRPGGGRAGDHPAARGSGKTAVHVAATSPASSATASSTRCGARRFDLIDAGVCDAETIDTVVKRSFGRRLGGLGPVENADLVGLDLTLAIHDYVLPDARPLDRASANGCASGSQRGELGAKTGRGFRDWEDGDADAAREEPPSCAPTEATAMSAAILTAALTGPIATKADNPALPTTPEEIAAAARERARGGRGGRPRPPARRRRACRPPTSTSPGASSA